MKSTADMNALLLLLCSLALFLAVADVTSSRDLGGQFISVPIKDLQVLERVQELQYLLENEGCFTSDRCRYENYSSVPPQRLHVQFSLANFTDLDLPSVQKALQLAADSFVWHFGMFRLKFRNLQMFDNGAMWVLVPTNLDEAEAFYEILAEAFRQQGLFLGVKSSPVIVVSELIGEPSRVEQRYADEAAANSIKAPVVEETVRDLELCTSKLDILGNLRCPVSARFNY